MEHLSNKEIEDIINKGLENRKAIFFSPLEIERIYNDALGSEDFEIMRLNLIQFETYLDGLMLKVHSLLITFQIYKIFLINYSFSNLKHLYLKSDIILL